MPFFESPHTTLYYDLFRPDITRLTRHPTILLLHGFLGTPTSDFAAQIPLLKQQYTILAPHLHGHGHSSHRTLYTASYYLEDVTTIIALLNALQLSQVLVIGFSDGAIVGLLLAALHPNRVAGLAIHGAQPIISTRDTAAIRSWLLEKPLSPTWQEQLTQLHGDPYWRSLLPLYVAVQEELVAEGGILITQEELAAIQCPTLIMHGTYDRVVNVEYAEMLHHAIPGSELRLFAAGHALHLRCEEEYTATVLDFLKNC